MLVIKKTMDEIPFRSKELSWLSFNSRVLQEAQSLDVPLLERLNFLGIYSSNLDDFFRVRVATLKRLIELKLPRPKLGIPDPEDTFAEINGQLKREAAIFNQTYAEVFRRLEEEGIFLLNEREVPGEHRGYLESYFESEVLPHLMPIVTKLNSRLGGLKDYPMYLAVRLTNAHSKSRPMHALLEIPQNLPRFHVLPSSGKRHQVMYLDDIIRFGLKRVFEFTHYDKFESYALKFTRDAELEFDDDITESFYDQVEESLKAREEGNPVRLNYDQDMPLSFLELVMDGLEAAGAHSTFPGARYHNRKDLMKFPSFGRSDLKYPARKIIVPKLFRAERGHTFSAMRRRDILLHFPYHSFNHFLDLLRQASMDPLVKSVSITHYRIAKQSAVARALIAARRNGKEVTVLVEPTARFDEEANLHWASVYSSAGIQVHLGVRGLKVHAKLCLIERIENGRTRYYSCVGSGNFNEETARLYTDHMLLTSNQEIGNDLCQVFKFFQRNYDVPKLKHLVLAPFTFRKRIYELIDKEIEEAQAGRRAEMWVKINNLSDYDTVAYLYRAAQAGVKVWLNVRGMFSLISGKLPGTENIRAIGIIDRLLEHARVLIFHNGGNPKTFITSADFLPRNFDGRIEVMCPIYDPAIQKQLRHYVDLQWRDNTKARVLDSNLSNQFLNDGAHSPGLRSQVAIEDYLASHGRSSGTANESEDAECPDEAFVTDV